MVGRRTSPQAPTATCGSPSRPTLAGSPGSPWRDDHRVHHRLTANSHPGSITTGPDGDLWFTEQADPGRIGRLTPAPPLTPLGPPVPPAATPLVPPVTTPPPVQARFGVTAVTGGVSGTVLVSYGGSKPMALSPGQAISMGAKVDASHGALTITTIDGQGHPQRHFHHLPGTQRSDGDQARRVESPDPSLRAQRPASPRTGRPCTFGPRTATAAIARPVATAWKPATTRSGRPSRPPAARAL